MSTVDPVERQFAEAAAEAMRQPGKEAVSYSRADREALARESTRLRAKADRLDALGGPQGASGE